LSLSCSRPTFWSSRIMVITRHDLWRALVVSITGSGMVRGAQGCGLGEDDVIAGPGMASRAWGRGLRCWRCHQLRSGMMAAHKGLNRGREWWCGGFHEDSTTAQSLWGVLNDGKGSGEVDDGAGSREIFGAIFWQPNGMSESLRGLGFTEATQWFIYRGTTIATGISDIIGAVATNNHSCDGPLPSSDQC
jgi:hypothetical protein